MYASITKREINILKMYYILTRQTSLTKAIFWLNVATTHQINASWPTTEKGKHVIT